MKVTSLPRLFTRCLFKSIQLFIYILLLTSFSIMILFDLSTKDQIVYVFSGQQISQNSPTPQKTYDTVENQWSQDSIERLRLQSQAVCGRTPTADVLTGQNKCWVAHPVIMIIRIDLCITGRAYCLISLHKHKHWCLKMVQLNWSSPLCIDSDLCVSLERYTVTCTHLE